MEDHNIFNFKYENSDITYNKDKDVENEFILDTDNIFDTVMSLCLKVINLFENSFEFSEMRKNMYL